MLHELDKELKRQGLRFVRYADDFSIYCKTHQQARKIGNATYLFLKDKLRLPINREKSGIRKPVQFTILGFRFVPTYEKGVKGKYQLVVSAKGWKRLKERLKETTRKTTPASFDERIHKLKEIYRGWINYFRYASIHGKLKELDGWLRNRLRYCIWSRIFGRRNLRGKGKTLSVLVLTLTCLCLEQDAEGRMGDCPTAKPSRIPIK